jgi:hypothetical protein
VEWTVAADFTAYHGLDAVDEIMRIAQEHLGVGPSSPRDRNRQD